MRFQCLDHLLFVHSALFSSKAAVERLWPLPRGEEGGGCVDDGQTILICLGGVTLDAA